MFTPDEVFGPGGALAAAHPDFELRHGQLEMAREVDRAFADGGTLLAEAGTGTGKTLAYLVPAVQSGRRVVVSTATRTLQEQIARKDVPFLRDRLGLDFSALMMKGRDNYLCLHRLEEFQSRPRFDFVDEIEPFSAVKRWAAETETGDRAEVAGLPDRVRFWRQINARSDTCLGRKCPVYEDCHLVRMRRQAEQTQILIVNHFLLFADLAVRAGDFGRVIPDYDCLVLDEAHRVEAIATQYLGRRLSSWRLKELVDDVARLAGGGPDGKITAAAAADLGACGGELFRRLGHRGEGRFRLEALPPVDDAARAVILAAGRLAGRLGAHPDDDEEAAERRAALRRRCDELTDDVQEIVTREDAEQVRWAEIRSGGVILHASPIDVSVPLREHLFSGLRTAVLTSATLSVAGSFAFVRRRLGLEEDSEEIAVGSPFDYGEQGVLYLPRDLPEPKDPGFIPESSLVVRRLLEVTAGRAFLLFTSFAHLGAMRRLLADETDYPLLVQGDGPRAWLLERFVRTPRAVLLGTTSFWEGVDVPGAALSLVVIDRLPFAVPGDPLLSARLDAIRRRGGDPFLEYQVPDAVLALKQGIGRLIRTTRDVGVLCVLDPRLTRRRYGAAFLESLPPFTREIEVDPVEDFFRARHRA